MSWISIWAGLCGNGILVTALGHNYIEKVGCACPGGTETIRSEDCERLPDGTLNPACLCNCPSGSDCPDYNTSSHNKCKCANGVGGILVVPHTAVGPDGVEHIIVCHDGFGNATYCSENQPWSWGGPRMDHRGSLDFTNQFYGVVDDCSNCSVQLINQYIGGGSFEIKKTPLGTLQRC